MSFVDPKPKICPRCDFGSGHRGMDWCHTFGGTGSVFWVRNRMYPNTKEGYQLAVYATNYDESIVHDMLY